MDDPHGSVPPRVGRARAWFERHRRALARGVLVLLVAIVIVQIGSVIPRETRVALPIGAGHRQVVEARLEYLQQEESVRALTLRWPGGAPSSIRDTVSLTPGDYDVELELVDRDGTRRRRGGRLTAPSDGVLRLALEER